MSKLTAGLVLGFGGLAAATYIGTPMPGWAAAILATVMVSGGALVVQAVIEARPH